MVFVKGLKTEDTENVKYFCLDNTGENLGLRHFLEKEGIETTLDFTSPDTPEQNGKVKKRLQHFGAEYQVCMLNWSGVIQELLNNLWAERAATATKLSNVMSRKDELSPCEKEEKLWEKQIVHEV